MFFRKRILEDVDNIRYLYFQGLLHNTMEFPEGVNPVALSEYVYPQQFLILQIGERGRVWFGDFPKSMVAFIDTMASNIFDGTEWEIYIDGRLMEKNTTQRRIGSIDNPHRFPIPIVVQNKIEIYARNGDVQYAHEFEFLVTGFLVSRGDFKRLKKIGYQG